jgi:hypothetical protein
MPLSVGHTLPWHPGGYVADFAADFAGDGFAAVGEIRSVEAGFVQVAETRFAAGGEADYCTA